MEKQKQAADASRREAADAEKQIAALRAELDAARAHVTAEAKVT